MLKFAIVVLAVYLVLGVIGRIDWAGVADAAARMHWWQVAIVLLVVLLRQALLGSPLSNLLPGLGVPRAVANGLVGTLITTFTPPPSELVLRMAMFKSWRIDLTKGAAALALYTYLSYLVRLAVPVLALLLAIAQLTASSAYWWNAAWSGGLAILLIVLLFVVSRGEPAAAKVGRTVGSLVHKVRHKVDPQAWSRTLVQFQRDSSENLVGRLVPGGLVMTAFVVADGIVLLLCMRFIGVSASSVSLLAMMTAFLCVYPLTIFPFNGFGVMEAALIVLLNDVGTFVEADLVGALLVWRAATLIFPLVPGGITLLAWWSKRPAQGAPESNGTGLTATG
ncbi:lysylphosphatidylglycerol synthase domain-containing protein [Nakamurella lactea]|uniref:lysylphosphatidylglycerol synthase domain-containing protein n=1 Tax=Nakamurella lactea TaxID=459515 RepID=UPI0003F85BD1|nr:lysylphosphatidylglycerol synthase domain-containing protein [Nakamurella lactea]